MYNYSLLHDESSRVVIQLRRQEACERGSVGGIFRLRKKVPETLAAAIGNRLSNDHACTGQINYCDGLGRGVGIQMGVRQGVSRALGVESQLVVQHAVWTPAGGINLAHDACKLETPQINIERVRVLDVKQHKVIRICESRPRDPRKAHPIGPGQSVFPDHEQSSKRYPQHESASDHDVSKASQQRSFCCLSGIKISQEFSRPGSHDARKNREPGGRTMEIARSRHLTGVYLQKAFGGDRGVGEIGAGSLTCMLVRHAESFSHNARSSQAKFCRRNWWGKSNRRHSRSNERYIAFRRTFL